MQSHVGDTRVPATFKVIGINNCSKNFVFTTKTADFTPLNYVIRGFSIFICKLTTLSGEGVGELLSFLYPESRVPGGNLEK